MSMAAASLAQCALQAWPNKVEFECPTAKHSAATLA